MLQEANLSMHFYFQAGASLQKAVLLRCMKSSVVSHFCVYNLHVYGILNYWTGVFHIDLCHSPVLRGSLVSASRKFQGLLPALRG